MRKIFDVIREQVLAEIEAQCPHPYHNRRHTEDVVARVQDLLPHVRLPLSDDEVELLLLAALFHDYGHSGKADRRISAVPRNDLGNEEYAALEAERHLSGKLKPQEIRIVKNLILATAEGHEPVSVPEKLLAFADIAGFLGGFDAWMEESLGVLHEAPFGDRPPAFEEWIGLQKGFLDYCHDLIAALRPHIEARHGDLLEAALERVRSGLETDGEKFQSDFEIANKK